MILMICGSQKEEVVHYHKNEHFQVVHRYKILHLVFDLEILLSKREQLQKTDNLHILPWNLRHIIHGYCGSHKKYDRNQRSAASQGYVWLEYKKHAAGPQKYQRCRNRQNMRYHKKYRMHRGVFWHQNNSVPY